MIPTRRDGEKWRLSPTQLSMMANCGIQYKFRYIDGIVLPPRAAMVTGKAGHYAAKVNFTAKQKTGKDEPLTVLQDAFAESFRAGIGEVEWKPDEVELGIPVAKNEYEQGGLVSVAAFLEGDPERGVEAVAPKIHPFEIEKPFTVELADFPVDLCGVIDVVDRKDAKNPRLDEIVDIKFSGRPPKADEADTSQQLTAYAAHFLVERGELPAQMRLEYVTRHISRKKGTINATTKTLATQRNQGQIDVYLNRVGAAVDALEKGVFLPASADWWGCSASWCGFHRTCPYWSGRE